MAKTSIESIYPLSSLQEGMLFHSTYNEDVDPYIVQLIYLLCGDLDVAAWRRAWQAVIQRHTALRTGFSWKRRNQPLQVVLKQAELKWEMGDWRDLSDEDRQRRFKLFLEADRSHKFDLSKAPLMRLALFQSTEKQHYCVCTLHHLIADRRTVLVMLQEVRALYNAFRMGEYLHLPPPRPYGEYIAWLKRQDVAEAAAFWRRYLEGFSTPTSFGTHSGIVNLAAGEKSFSTNEEYFSFSEETSRASLEIGRRKRLTINTLMQGAWALLLSRYTGENDVVFGTTVFGRPPELEGAENMVGMFLNTLAVRAKILPDLQVIEWLRKFQMEQVEARQYDYMPLHQVQSWTQIPRGVPLFESLVVVENHPAERLRGEKQSNPLEIRTLNGYESSVYPLSLTASSGTRLGIKITYQTHRFDTDTILRMIGHYRNLLEGIVANPDQRLSELPLLTDAEREQILVEWNQTGREYQDQRCVHHLFEAGVDKGPERVALINNGQRLSFRELNRKANQLAHYLRSLGVGPGVFIGICLERSCELVVAWLGVLKAGGAYLPLDPGYPEERLRYMVEDARVQLLLTQESLLGRLPRAGARLLCLDREREAIARHSHRNPPGLAETTDLAYLIYTSGSTGKPKAVMVQHDNLTNAVFAAQDQFEFRRDDVMPCLAPFAFDIFLFELTPVLLAGGTVLLLTQEEILQIPRLVRALKQATRLHAVPSLMRQIVEFWQANESQKEASGLRSVFVGGDRVPGELLRQMRKAYPNSAIYVLYGPTEATIICSSHPVGSEEETERSLIGRPLGNMVLRLCDGSRNLVPIGVPGEIYVGGAGVTRGYLNREDLTADKYVRIDGERYYRTGDLARYRPDGNLEFLGRIDDQVKIRGYRIELGEVEAALAQHLQVHSAVAVTREDSEGDKRLIAYYLPGEPGLNKAELRRYLQERLPDYMVPSQLVELEQWPLTPQGKIDRRALSAMELSGEEYEQTHVAPRTQLEEVLSGIWEQLLGLEKVGVEDQFFELGGHSLLAMRVMSRMRELLGVDLPVRALFESPTVAQLARRVEQRGEMEELPELSPGTREGNPPLSFAQERLWFMQHLEPESVAYHIPMALRLSGELDVEALRRSLSELVRRHEPLRTTFQLREGAPVQVIGPAEEISLEAEDWKGGRGEEQPEAVARVVEEEVRRRFDLERGPLMRARLLRIDECEHVLVLVMHHIVSDGWSMGILRRELSQLYAGRVSGEAIRLPPLKVQYADYAEWQRKVMRGGRLERQLGYWKGKLEGAPAVLELPTDCPRPAVSTGAGAWEGIEIETDLSRELKALSRREGATLYMTLLTAFKVLLSRYTGQRDIVVGTTIAGRTRAETEPLIGMFFNMLALRTEVVGGLSFRQLLGCVRETTLEAYTHQDAPFERVVAELGVERSRFYSPVFQVIFELHNVPRAGLSLAGLKLEGLEVRSNAAKFDLTVAMQDGERGLRGVVEYSRDLFEESTIRRLIGHYERLLRGIVSNPDEAVGRLPLLTDAEREQLLLEWNATRSAYGEEECMHEMFERQVEKTPWKVALIYEEQELSYWELNRRANQVGHRLRKLGVGPEVRVGIYLKRSPEMVIGLLGVLKAGGAYVPLDANYPAERLAYVLEDSGARVLVTEKSVEEKLPRTNSAEVLYMDEQWEGIGCEPNGSPQSGVGTDNLAYVYYTSGSTGRPKGVAMAHKGIANYIRWGVEAYGAGEGNGAAVHSSIAVDLTLTNFLPLFVGKAVTLSSELSGVEGLVSLIRREPGWGLLKVTPTHLSLLNPQLKPEEMANSAQVLVIGADNLVAEPTLVWRERAPEVRLINEYGPTETVVGCSIYRIGAKAPRVGGVPIGKPIANIRMYVLDEEYQAAPIGVSGELYIGGIGVARGYIGRGDLTAEKFVPDIYGEEVGGRMYRTGDRARYLRDGNLEFLGRMDYQVKIRGYRVELGEVEAVVSEHPGVKKALVMAREDESGEKRLVAYVGVGTGSVTTMELRKHLRERLPEYMAPASYVIMKELPVGSSGKIDRKALPLPEYERPTLSAGYVAPIDHVELQLVQIWEDVLGVQPIGTSDNFFELGGHSILALLLLRRMKERFQQDIPLATLIQGGTISDVAAAFRKQLDSGPQRPSVLVPIQPSGTRAPLFCVHPAGGGVLSYLNLTRFLGFDQPVYGLQDPLYPLGDMSTLSIKGFAEIYVNAIVRIQAHGPYHLAGWSFGGTVAFEMAQQLRGRGEEVAFLAMLDTINPLYGQCFVENDLNSCKILAGLARERATGRGKDLILTAEELIELKPKLRYQYVMERLKALDLMAPEIGPEVIERWLDRWWMRSRTLQDYKPNNYPGRITVFRAMELDPENTREFPEIAALHYRDPSLGWAELSSMPTEVYYIPGYHSTMGNEPNVLVLAAKMNECLSRLKSEKVTLIA